MTLKDVLQTIVALGVAVGLVFGAITFFATKTDVAKADETAKIRDDAMFKELKLTQKMLEQKISSDQVLDLKRRMRQLKEWNQWKPISRWSVKDRTEYEELEIELKEAESNLKEIKKRNIPEVTPK